MADSNDKELGMDRGMTRRDFLNGVAITTGASLVPPHVIAALANEKDPEKAADYYPPILTGLRGSHIGSFEAAHTLRDGDFWKAAPTPIETGEKFDLIIVGGGISGLSAAHFYRKQNSNARILIIENHDDFGGHAKRNEFDVGGYKRLAFGGTFSIESPAPYSPVAKALVEGAAASGAQAQYLETPEQAGEWLARELRPGDAVLLKASRGVKLERALEKLQ